ncbi:MAG: DNA-3-methyladenine glycosylase [Nitrososphaerales archaeon]
MSIAKTPVDRSFYARDTITVTKDILGRLLVRRTPEDLLIGRIVEAEAYRGADDPASHSYRGRTRRNEVMFGKPGVAYVYFTYGNHYCLNVVTEQAGVAAAVLIRAVEPLVGIEVMKKNRGVGSLTDLASGPGKLTKAFQITREDNGRDVTDASSPLTVCEPAELEEFKVVQTTRIGIRVARERPWRFYIQGNPHVSKR